MEASCGDVCCGSGVCFKGCFWVWWLWVTFEEFVCGSRDADGRIWVSPCVCCIWGSRWLSWIEVRGAASSSLFLKELKHHLVLAGYKLKFQLTKSSGNVRRVFCIPIQELECLLRTMVKGEGGIKALLGMVQCEHPDVLVQVASGIVNFAKWESEHHLKVGDLVLQDTSIKSLSFSRTLRRSLEFLLLSDRLVWFPYMEGHTLQLLLLSSSFLWV
ncbi:hypothetical protein Droror1_Dr00025340 [Drosera rotundifolia]